MQTTSPSILKRLIKKEVGSLKRILDVGCGDGTIALYLITYLNCYIEGIDLDKGKVHRANEKLRRRPHKGFATCSVYSIENADRKTIKEPFDVVLMVHTLHHLTNIKKALSKSKSVLKQKGKIIIAEYTPSFGEKVDDCPRFSISKVKSLFKRAGFKNIEKHTINKNLFIIKAVK